MTDEPQKKVDSASSPQGDTAAPEPSREEKLKKCEAERQEYLDGWKRARADFINYQKDEARRFEAFAKFAAEDMLTELILVLDSFDLAIAEHAKSQGDAKGMLMVRSQLEDVLKKRGLAAIEVKQGEKFNPAYHEAVAEKEGGAAGAIVEEIKKGYTMHGKVIRAAKVVVAK